MLSYQPDRLTREHPLRENLGDHRRRAARAGPVDLAPFTRARDRVADRGDRGRAALRVDRGPRGRAVRRLRRRRRGAGRRPARAAQRVAHRDAGRHRRGAARPPLARVPPRCCGCSRPAERPMSAGRARRRGRRVRGRRRHPACRPARSTGAAARHGRAGRRPRGGPRPRRIEHGFVRREADGRPRDPPRARGPRDRRRPAAVAAPPLPRGAGRRRSRASPVVAAALLAARPPPRRGAGASHRGRAGSRSRVEAPQDALAVLERGLDLPAPRGRRAGDRRAADAADAPRGGRTAARDESLELTGPRRRGRVRRRRGRPARSPTRRAPSRRSASGRDRLRHAVLEARLGQYRLAAGDVAGATAALRHAADVAPPRAERRAGADPRAARAGADDRGRVPGRGAGRRRGARGRPAWSGPTPSPRRSTP